jgi:threonyl-tRNA synthetase
MVSITFIDGSRKEYSTGVRAGEIAASLGRKVKKEALVVRVNGEIRDLTWPLTEDASIEFLNFDTDEGKKTLWHSTSHIMAHAVCELFPDTALAIGPAIEGGFYYDFDRETPFTVDDLQAIEKKMKEIVEGNYPFTRELRKKEDALRFFEKNNQAYKVELIRELDVPQVSFYTHDGFTDLCAGPHVPSTGYVKAFKLLSVAGAYWRGDESNPMLQRIYGISFRARTDLEHYLKDREEAKARDHRVLGPQLDLFHIFESAGPGLSFWGSKGTTLKEIIENFWKEVHREWGYEIVTTPHIARSHLWRTSGHFDFYRENMFLIPFEDEKEHYVLKPMNCPGHILIYQSRLRSYRDLPVRYAELGTVYRYERSGTLHGLFRVRGFTQDDAHIFCTRDQVVHEIERCFDLAVFFLKTFGLDYTIELSVRDPARPEKYAGDDESWLTAEQALVDALRNRGASYRRMEGEAVFYGPKIDMKLIDSLHRKWQGTTIQFDFNLPSRFGVEFIDSDNNATRAIMIHRALLGSIERFIAILVEHYNGLFPLWLAPVQAVLLNVTDGQLERVGEIETVLREAGFRVQSDLRNEKVGYKVREAELQKIPYIAVVGDREVESGEVAVRRKGSKKLSSLSVEQFLDLMKKEVENRSLSSLLDS